jgi:predicted DNA-binding transcriptional regulator YafY
LIHQTKEIELSTTTTKLARLEKALVKGETITIAKAQTRFGYASPNSVTRAIATLRDRGVVVATVRTKTGQTAYIA